jgi:hypothetical protein
MDRSQLLLDLRKEAPVFTTPKNTLEQEQFQNNILRPILKFQNELIVTLFINYAKRHKSLFFELSLIEKHTYIQQSIQRDQKLRILYIGIVIALFSQEEYKHYTLKESLYNKRIISMVMVRLKDQIIQLYPDL